MWQAAQTALRTQFGFTGRYRTPLSRGPLARMGTLFWSFPVKEAQFLYRGLTDSVLEGDGMRFARFALLTGGQLWGIAAVINLLGAEAPAVYKFGFMPIKPFAQIWDLMGGAYEAAFGKRADDRQKGSEAMYNAILGCTIPQYYPAKGIVQSVQALKRGYRVGGAKEMPISDTSAFVELLNVAGFHPRGPHLAYDLLREMDDVKKDQEFKKSALLLSASKAMEKGNMEGVQEVFQKARDKQIPLSYGDLQKYHHDRTTMSLLEQRLKSVPRNLRGPIKKQIDELQERMGPTRREEEHEHTMWSGPKQFEETEEAEE
jgi:hypothetical protein